jgi:CRISPR-associated protein Csx10
MTQLLVTIKTVSPLYAGAFKPYGSFLETKGEIPGALLRGAVAARTLPDCAAPEFKQNHEACAVKDICPFYYLTTGVAYPTCAISEGGFPTEPPLRTMVTCKVAPGFLSQSEPHEPKHGVFDTLLHHLAFNELRRLNAPPSRLPPQRCQHQEENQTCDAALEPFSRRYIRERSTRYHLVPSPSTRRMTHVGINRARETAEPGLLYSVQSVAEQTQFVGHMALPDSWDETRVGEFKKALCNINRIGGEQTYGLGRVEVAVREVDDDAEDISTRVSEFNEKLQEVWGEYAAKGAPPTPNGYYFTVDLLTPALLTTPDGTPTVQLTAAMLKQRAEEVGSSKLPELEVVNGLDASGTKRPLMFTGPTIVSGWSEAWGLPKPPALAAVAGSGYVFFTSDIKVWHEALRTIEGYGIGSRREEGFGAVRICDPFHLEVQPV